MTLPARHYRELFALIAAVGNEKDAALLMRDILTPQELDSVAERWQEIQMLASGLPQRTIAAKLGISISKITRGSHALKHGTGGFNRMLTKMKKVKNN
ncbi:MAG: transcriptional regulator [Candidatus Peribacteraceae bacterium]|nr:transcriptional regulator [Candidatus Peribacteraceae bacterium]